MNADPGYITSGSTSNIGQTTFEMWGPIIGQFTFSFFAGYAIGFMLRMASHIFLFIGGFVLALLFLLQYNDFVIINWGSIGHIFDGNFAWLSEIGGGFMEYMANNLPSGVGFFAGLVSSFKN